jgi:membrane-bound lytic murein transglycosylase B
MDSTPKLSFLFRLITVVIVFFAPAMSADENDIDAESFHKYLDSVRETARKSGISTATLDVAFTSLEPDPRVIVFDRRQPEFTQTFEEYLGARVSDSKVKEARRQYNEHQEALLDIAEAYDVDPEYLVAFWGLESSFGRYQGKYDIVRSLATLGHDKRRSAFFTRQLIAALQILDQGHVSRAEFVGGWAGAMGQNQFMPSTFLDYAVDYDKDGRKDIWSNKLDVWASIASYLKRHKWQRGAGWGFRVVVPDELDMDELAPREVSSGCRALRQHSRKMGLAQWQQLHVARDRKASDHMFALLQPDEGESSGFLVGGNFRAILSYNCANKYAVSVGLLADLIRQQSS